MRGHGARLVALFKLCLVPLIGWTLSIAAARAIGARVDWPGVAACILGILAAYRLDDVLDRLDDGLNLPTDLFTAEARRDLLIIAIAAAGLLGIAIAHPRLHVDTSGEADQLCAEPGLDLPELDLPLYTFPDISMYFGGVSVASYDRHKGFEVESDSRRESGVFLSGTRPQS